MKQSTVLGTFGVSVYPCAMPGKPHMFELSENQMELGLGIHGEPGLERVNIQPAHQIVATILEKLTASKRLKLTKKEPLAVLVNNLGSVSQLEFGILQGEIVEWLCKLFKL